MFYLKCDIELVCIFQNNNNNYKKKQLNVIIVKSVIFSLVCPLFLLIKNYHDI
jgi:hypothetical protein